MWIFYLLQIYNLSVTKNTILCYMGAIWSYINLFTWYIIYYTMWDCFLLFAFPIHIALTGVSITQICYTYVGVCVGSNVILIMLPASITTGQRSAWTPCHHCMWYIYIRHTPLTFDTYITYLTYLIFFYNFIYTLHF